MNHPKLAMRRQVQRKRASTVIAVQLSNFVSSRTHCHQKNRQLTLGLRVHFRQDRVGSINCLKKCLHRKVFPLLFNAFNLITLQYCFTPITVWPVRKFFTFFHCTIKKYATNRWQYLRVLFYRDYSFLRHNFTGHSSLAEMPLFSYSSTLWTM